MSRIFEYLKEKASDPKYQNKLYYIENNYYEKGNHSSTYTFKEVYDSVLKFMELYQENGLENIQGKPCFLATASVVEDIISMIALMELGAKPVLIQKDSLYIYNRKNDNDSNLVFPYEVAPLIRFNEEKIPIVEENILNGTQITSGFHSVANPEDVKVLLENNIDTSCLDQNNYDFALLTSGTTGKKKVFPMNEEILIKNIQNNYELNESELYLCQNPISSISGLIFTCFLPLIGHNKGVASCFSFGYKNDIENTNYDWVNMITATSFLNESYAFNKYFPVVSHDTREKVNRLTLLGSKINYNSLNMLRKLYPKVNKENTLIYYGRTENYGLISKVNENEIEPVYIYESKIYPNEIIYTYNKKDIYALQSVNNVNTTNKLNIEFSDNEFTMINNIAILDKPKENIEILGPLFGEIMASNIRTSDYGFILNDRIYLLSRDDELLKTEDYYVHIPSFEKMFGELIHYLIPDINNCYVLKDRRQLNLYIPCPVKPYCDDNFANNRVDLGPLLDRKMDGVFNKVILFNDNDIRQGDEIGKFKKHKLLDLQVNHNAIKINSEEDALKALYSDLSKLLNKKVELDIDEYTRYYIFPKKEYSARDIAKIVLNFRVLEYKEDESNYYLSISDEFLFGKFTNKKSLFDEDKIIEEIESGQFRKNLLYTNKLFEHQIFKIGLFYNEDNRLTAVVLDEFSYPERKNIHNPERNMEKYWKKSEAVIEHVVLFNKYDYYYRTYYNTIEFSIDDNNNFYRDNQKYPIGYYSTDICYIMYNFLLDHKDYLKKGGKQYDKH